MDKLEVYQHPEGTFDLVMIHEGNVGIRSKPLPLSPGRSYKMEVDMGSLYPPEGDPRILTG